MITQFRSTTPGFVIFHNRLTEKGDTIPGHRHQIGHDTRMLAGTAHFTLTRPDGSVVQQDLSPPGKFFVPADVLHEIRAVTDWVEFDCVFRDHDPVTGEPLLPWPEWHALHPEKSALPWPLVAILGPLAAIIRRRDMKPK